MIFLSFLGYICDYTSFTSDPLYRFLRHVQIGYALQLPQHVPRNNHVNRLFPQAGAVRQPEPSGRNPVVGLPVAVQVVRLRERLGPFD